MPFVIFVGSGVWSLTLVKNVVDPMQKKVLVVACLGLVAAGLVFMIPAVNVQSIGVFWFLTKVSFIIYLLIWFRGTFPRFRYDQLMNIGWKVMIPIGMGAIIVNALLGMI